jgi:hypothetical protein
MGEAVITPELVTGAVDAFSRSGDENLQHVQSAVARTSQEEQRLLAQVLQGQRVRFDRNRRALADLELLGVLRDDGGVCAVRNQIYKTLLSL